MSNFRWSNGSTSQFALRLTVWAGVALANPWVQLLLLIGAAAALVAAGVWLHGHRVLFGALFVAAGYGCALPVLELNRRMDSYVFEEDDEEPELMRLRLMVACWFLAALVLVPAGAALIGMRVG